MCRLRKCLIQTKTLLTEGVRAQPRLADVPPGSLPPGSLTIFCLSRALQTPSPEPSPQGEAQEKYFFKACSEFGQALGHQEQYVLEPRLRVASEHLAARSGRGVLGPGACRELRQGFSKVFPYQCMVRSTVHTVSWHADSCQRTQIQPSTCTQLPERGLHKGCSTTGL